MASTLSTVGSQCPSKWILAPSMGNDMKRSIISEICTFSIPGWSTRIASQDHIIIIRHLTEGLSNELYKVELCVNANSTGETITSANPIDGESADLLQYKQVLFRIYGEHVSSFYEPHIELLTFRVLSDLHFGPKLIASGSGWRIEEFYEDASTVLVRNLPSPSVVSQVALQLARLHKVHKMPGFPSSDIIPRIPVCAARLISWMTAGIDAINKSNIQPDQLKASLRIDAVVAEINTALSMLASRQTESAESSVGWDVVFCHNDLQENNLMLTRHGLQLVDFEYAHFNFQSADIANFFNEFCIDYLHPEYPFFSTNLQCFPNLEVQRLFASVYLSEYWGQAVYYSSHAHEIDQLLSTVALFSQINHLLWGMWSLVRAQQLLPAADATSQSNSPTLSFDFVAYAKFRFDWYFTNKQEKSKSDDS